MLSSRLALSLAGIVFCATVAASTASADEDIRDIAFPTYPGAVTFNDNYGDPRYGHSHEGIDIMGPKMTPLYSAIDGEVRYIVDPEPSYGYMVVLEDNDGYTYHYIHINNDTPGADDGNGGTEHAYAPGIYRGANVSRGQLIGWMGDSGNAENIASHLHFEIRRPGGDPINPYASLTAAVGELSYNPVLETAGSPDINSDKDLSPVFAADAPCESGSRIKPAGSTAVYYCGANGKRYVFPNDRAYFTWYPDFKGVQTLTDAEIAAVPLGGNVTYRPGVRMVKIQSDPSVYAVSKGGVLRWVQTEGAAKTLYGADWAKQVDDVSDAFFFSYTIGEPISWAQ